MARSHTKAGTARHAILLSGTERTLVKDHRVVEDEGLRQKLSAARKGEPLLLSTGDIESLCHALGDTSKAVLPRHQEAVEHLLDKLEACLPEPAGGAHFLGPGHELRNGIAQLLALMGTTGASPIQTWCQVPLVPEDRLLLSNVLSQFDALQYSIRTTPDGAPVRLRAIDLATACFVLADQIDRAQAQFARRLEDIAIVLISALVACSPRRAVSGPTSRSTPARRTRSTVDGRAPRLTLSVLQRRALARVMPDLATRLKLDEPNARVIPVTEDELGAIATAIHQDLMMMTSRKEARALLRIIDAIDAAQTEAIAPDTVLTNDGFRLRIELQEIAPAIWRRIDVPDCTLVELHHYIQAAMGWYDAHLHCFQVGDRRFQPVEQIDPDFEVPGTCDPRDVTLSAIARDRTLPFTVEYEYDFGDGWCHDIVIEQQLDQPVATPVCRDGARACPPEDVGGAWGYAEYIEAMADPTHPDHEEWKKWRRNFAPEAFDPRVIDLRLARCPKPERKVRGRGKGRRH